jgi:hypothetical protein
MTIQFCKSCQQNNVNTRVEWRPNPDKPGKKKQFDIDKNEWHTCPYWKPDPNYKSKQGFKANVPDDVKQEFAKIEQEVKQNSETAKQYSNNDIMLAINNLQISVSTIEAAIRQFTKDVGEALAKMSFEKANKL